MLAALVILLAGSVIALAQEGPEIAVDPGAAAPGSLVSVSGTGWSGDCGVNLFLDEPAGSPLGTAFPDEEGAFAITVVVPADAAAGEHLLVAQGLAFDVEFCGGPSGTIARTPLTVVAPSGAPATIILDQLEGTPGSTVDVSGAGFCADPACGPVVVLFAGQPAKGDVTVQPDGTFEAELIVPAGATVGQVHVAAVQTDAAGGEIVGMGEFNLTNKPATGQEEEVEIGAAPAGPARPRALPSRFLRAAVACSSSSCARPGPGALGAACARPGRSVPASPSACR